MHDPSTSKTHRAMTLIELAATAVALAVLAVCLLPATAGVVSSSKQSRCLGNLARIGYANLIYAAEDPANMALPVHPLFFAQSPFDPTHIGAYEWGGKSGVGSPAFVDGPSDGQYAWITSKYGTKAGFGPGTRPLNRIFFTQDFPDYLHPVFDRAGAFSDTQLDLDVYKCPSDTGYTGAHCSAFEAQGLTSYDHFGNSYSANILMTGSGGNSPISSNSPYLHRMSDIPNPATTLAYQENNGRWAWAVDRENPSCLWIGNGLPGRVRGWHGKDWTFGATFIDGHADMIYMRGYRNPRIFEEPDEQTMMRCIIIRGDGWQKDTLPAPRVSTGLIHVSGGRPSYEDCVATD